MLAVILVAEGTQDEEFLYPYYRLKEDDFEVVSVGSGEVASKKGSLVVYGKYKIPLPVNDLSSNLLHEKYLGADLVIVPGGWQGPEILRDDKNVLDYLRYMNEKNRTIGAICHGPWVLNSAGISDGRTLTCFHRMKYDVICAGGRYVEAGVVVDKNLVTAPHYNNNPEFMREVLKNVRERRS